MKKILFYLHFTKIGGAELVAMQYMQGLIEIGYEVDLIVDFNMGEDRNTLECAIPKEINFKYIKSEKISKFIYNLRTLGKKNKIFNLFLYGFIILFDFYFYHAKVKKILVKREYDYTISFYQFLPAYLTSFKPTKHIIWLHGSIEHFFGGVKSLFKKSYEIKLNRYDYVVTTANEMKEQLEYFYPNFRKEKIKMLYNPFDFEKITITSNKENELNNNDRSLLDDNFICTVTRLDEHQKDLTALILAYEKLYLTNKIKEKLYVIGGGPSRNSLEELVKAKNLQKQILFLGEKINPYIWMKNAKIFILSSKFEGFGLVLVDAMAVETFVISSNCKTGPKEILHDGECGDLFEVGNSEELANKLGYALANALYRKEKIKLATERIKMFGKDNILIMLNNILTNKD